MERIPNKFLRVLHRHGIFEVKDLPSDYSAYEKMRGIGDAAISKSIKPVLIAINRDPIEIPQPKSHRTPEERAHISEALRRKARPHRSRRS